MSLKTKIIIIGVVLLSLLATFVFIFKSSNNIFRSSFTIKISGDFTSSGASRNYDANIVFRDNKVFSGSQKYFVGEGGGCRENCEHLTLCSIKDSKWVDSTTGGDCTLGKNEYLSKDSLVSLIKENKLKPMRSCGHLDVCYEITK